jgi:hypothetical protein
MTKTSHDELLGLLRMRVLSERNADEAAKEQLMIEAAYVIEGLLGPKSAPELTTPNPLSKSGYAVSEGNRLVIGFENVDDLVAAHQYVAQLAARTNNG